MDLDEGTDVVVYSADSCRLLGDVGPHETIPQCIGIDTGENAGHLRQTSGAGSDAVECIGMRVTRADARTRMMSRAKFP